MSTDRTLPNKIDQFKVVLVNFEKEFIDVTALIDSIEIHEGIFSPFASIDFILTDALGITERFPIIGDEHIIVTYKTPGENFKIRTRAFKLYKTGERVEAAQRQYNYVLFGIDEFGLLQETKSVDKSFVGQNVIKAIDKIYYNVVTSGADVQGTFQEFSQSLYGRDKEGIKESKNETSYVATGNSPMEAITHLRQEALHKDTRNNSDYVFFQNVDGYHITTLGELKEERDAQDSEENKKEFLFGDQSIPENNPDERFTAQNIILNARVKKTIDTLQNLATGMFRNRVAVVDPLTKRYDSRTFLYFNEFGYLQKLNEGSGKRIHAKNSQFRFMESSTHTRYMVGELTTNRLNPSSPYKQFDGNLNYKDSPYISEAANVDKDPKIKYPNERHKRLNLRIAERASLDVIILELLIPGNSDVKAGDVIYVFAPQASASPATSELFNLFYGNVKSRFLVTAVDHKYERQTANYVTRLECMKDAFELSPEGIRKIVKAEFTE